MEYKTDQCLHTEKLLGFHMHFIRAPKAGSHFSKSSTLHYEKLHSLAVTKVTIWHKFLILLDRVFSELLGKRLTHSLFKEVGLKRLLIYTLEMLVGTL